MKKIQIWENSDIDGEIDHHSYNLTSIDQPDDTLVELTDAVTKQRVGHYIDDGDGLKIVMSKHKLKLNYAEAAELLILLMHNTHQNYEFIETKTIKSF
jgi:hypothetical protein